MTYFTIKALYNSIERILHGDITHEHRTSGATLGLLRNYFPVNKFVITPEQIQEYSRKRPDYAIELFSPIKNTFFPHCFVEVKRINGSSIKDILAQVEVAICDTMDN